MATTTGQSSKTSGGGYIESRITYTVSNNVATITKLEVRKRPSTLTQSTSGTWKYEIGYNWDNAQKSGSIRKSVGTSWVTLWSSTVKIDITKNGGSDNVIYGTVTAPTGTTYEGLSARAAIRIEYEEPEPEPDPDPEPSYRYTVTIEHYYGDTLLNTDYEYDVIEGALYYLEDCARTYSDYVYSYGTVDGVTLIQTRIFKDTTIKLYYIKPTTWSVSYPGGTTGIIGGTFNFAAYQILCWQFRADQDGKIIFYSSGGSGDPLGWINNSSSWDVNDNGEPLSGYYLKKNDDYDRPHFRIEYNISEGETIWLFATTYQGAGGSNITISFSFQKSTYEIIIQHCIPDNSTSGSWLATKVLTYNVASGTIMKLSDYVQDLGSAYVLSHVTVRGTTTTAENLSTVSVQANRDEVWKYYYRKLPWDWNSQNDSASAENTQKAYLAVTQKKRADEFHHTVWNDLCTVTNKVLSNKSLKWNSKYATLDATKMSSSDKTLTAVRFNSLRLNIDQIANTGIGEKTKYNGVLLDSNKVIGNEFIILTNCLNRA